MSQFTSTNSTIDSQPNTSTTSEQQQQSTVTKKSHHSHYDDYDENGTRPNGQLSTSSPAGIAAASAVTPDKLANLLLNEGPLAIRHLTSHLANIIPGFSNLSLSKQRRLIIAALDSGDPITGCVFEKVGWGQWAARHVGSEFVKQRQAEINKAQNSNVNNNTQEYQDTVMTHNENDSSSSNNTDFHSSKSLSPSMVRKPSESYGWKNRRDSISKQLASSKSTHNPPRSPRVSFRSNKAERIGTTTVDEDVEDAILSSSSDDDDEDDDDDSNNISGNNLLHRGILPSSVGNINSVASYTSYPGSITSPIMSPGSGGGPGGGSSIVTSNIAANSSNAYHVGKPYRRRYSSNSRRSSTNNKYVGAPVGTTAAVGATSSSSTSSLPLSQQSNNPTGELMDPGLNNRFQFHDRQRSHSSIIASPSSSSTSPPTTIGTGVAAATSSTVHNIVVSPTVASSSISTTTSRRQSRSSFGTSESSPPFFGSNSKLGGLAAGNSIANGNVYGYANNNSTNGGIARASIGSSGSARVRSRLSSFNAEENKSQQSHHGGGSSTGSSSGAMMDELQTFRQNNRRQSFNESFIRGGTSAITSNGEVKKPYSSSPPKRINISSLTNPAPAASSSTLKIDTSENGNSAYHSDTDEEDWASMGPMESAKGGDTGTAEDKFEVKKPLQVREEAAALALMNLSAH